MKILIILGLIIINIVLYKQLNNNIQNKKIEKLTPTDVSGNNLKPTDVSGSPVINKSTNTTNYILVGVLIFVCMCIIGFLLYYSLKSNKDGDGDGDGEGDDDDEGRNYRNSGDDDDDRNYKESKGRDYSNNDDGDEDGKAKAKDKDKGRKYDKDSKSKGPGFFKRLFTKSESDIENDNRINKLKLDTDSNKKQLFIFNSSLASLLAVTAASELYKNRSDLSKDYTPPKLNLNTVAVTDKTFDISTDSLGEEDDDVDDIEKITAPLKKIVNINKVDDKSVMDNIFASATAASATAATAATPKKKVVLKEKNCYETKDNTNIRIDKIDGDTITYSVATPIIGSTKVDYFGKYSITRKQFYKLIKYGDISKSIDCKEEEISTV